MAAQEDKKPSVEYNWLSENAGIKVSNICLGTMTFGARYKGPLWILPLPSNTDEATSHQILDRYVELGGNFVDTANIYTMGESEEIIGSWLSKRERSSIILASELRFGVEEPNPNFTGLSRNSILDNLDKSLKRLQTDYLDLYYMHCWDGGVKLEETLRTLNDCVRSGKVRYVGISNVTAGQLQKIIDYNKFLGFDQSVVLQPEYNLLERSIEHEIVRSVKDGGLGIVPYSPLKGGLLTGKFKRDHKDVTKSLQGTRLAWTAEAPSQRTHSISPNVEQYRDKEDYWTLISVLEKIGKKYGVGGRDFRISGPKLLNDFPKRYRKSVTQVSLRWLLQRDLVSSVIIGAKSVAQLEENMGAGSGWSLTTEEVEELTKASQFNVPNPGYPFNFINSVNSDRTRFLP